MTFSSAILRVPFRTSSELHYVIRLRCGNSVQLVGCLLSNTHCTKNASSWIIGYIPSTNGYRGELIIREQMISDDFYSQKLLQMNIFSSLVLSMKYQIILGWQMNHSNEQKREVAC